jgi:hypothetical protein
LDSDNRITNRNELVTQWAKEKDSVVVDKYNEYEDQIVALKNQKQDLTDESDPTGEKANKLED